MLLLFMALLWASVVAAEPGSRLQVDEYFICEDSESSPYLGADFETKEKWVRFEHKLGERRVTDRRMLFGQWQPGVLFEPFAGSSEPVPPQVDVWGRRFLEWDLAAGTFSGYTDSGVLWELCEIDADTAGRGQPRYPRYELRRDGLPVYSFVAGEATVPGIAAAWIHGDSCVIEYRYSSYERGAPIQHHLILNGRPLDAAADCRGGFALLYLADQPFCFFDRDGLLGWSFAGRETVADYDLFFYDQCCEPGTWNPYFRKGGFEMIARRESAWYLIVGTVVQE